MGYGRGAGPQSFPGIMLTLYLQRGTRKNPKTLRPYAVCRCKLNPQADIFDPDSCKPKTINPLVRNRSTVPPMQRASDVAAAGRFRVPLQRRKIKDESEIPVHTSGAQGLGSWSLGVGSHDLYASSSELPEASKFVKQTGPFKFCSGLEESLASSAAPVLQGQNY